MEKISKAMRAFEDVEVPKSVEIPKELPKTKSKPTKIKEKKSTLRIKFGQ